MRIPSGRSSLQGSGHLFPPARRWRASLVVATALLSGAIFTAEATAASGPAATQKRLNAMAARISRMETTVELTARRVASLEKAVKRAETKVTAARGGIVALTQSLYMGSLTGPAALLNSQSVTEFGERVTFIEHLRAGDRDTLQRVSIARVTLSRQRLTLRRVLTKQRTLLKSLGKDRVAMSRMLREEQTRIVAIERAAKRSNRRARASRSDPPIVGGAGPFQVCPVDRARAYSNDWGAPRGSGRRHQGNDIIANRGTPIRAPFDGKFTRNSSGSGGLQARVFGAKGYVFNAHLDSYPALSNGAQVSVGTIIGYVGNSGNAQGGVTHNHFEWHPGGGGAVNPFRFLNLVC